MLSNCMSKDADKPVREGKVGMSFRVSPEARRAIKVYMAQHDIQLDELLLRGLILQGVLPAESSPAESAPIESASPDGSISAEDLEALLR